jgi:putative ABC transport system substrate-binding protein
VEAFRRGLRDLGYVEGKNIVIEYRWAEGRYERLPDLAAALVRLEVDVIFAVVQPAALAARKVGMRPLVAHCHLGPGRLARQTGARARSAEHLATAVALYRDMHMRFWLSQAEGELGV